MNKLMQPPQKIPDSLQELCQNAERQIKISLSVLEKMPANRKHLACIHRCLLILDELQSGHPRNVSHTAIQDLIRRLEDVSLVAFMMMMTGYYQASFALQRDVLETGFLLDLFLHDQKLIEKWYGSEEQARRDNFQPWQVRKLLAGDGADRGRIYRMLCEYATHPTPKGAAMLATATGCRAGARFDSRQLESCMGELVRNLSYFSFVCCRLLIEELSALRPEVDRFAGFLSEWVMDSYKLSISLSDSEGTRKWAIRLWPVEKAGRLDRKKHML